MFIAIIRFFSDYIRVLIVIGLYVVYCLYKNYQLNLQPFPGENDSDGPLAIKSLNEWNALLKKHNIGNRNVIIDFYATWCPPCRTIAPTYAKISKESRYSIGHKNETIFCKCNVDKAPDVARACRVTAMPTFKVFRKEVEVFSITGWNEAKIRRALHVPGASGGSGAVTSTAAGATSGSSGSSSSTGANVV